MGETRRRYLRGPRPYDVAVRSSCPLAPDERRAPTGDDRRAGLSQRPCIVFPFFKRSQEGGAAIENHPGGAAAVALPRRFPLFAPEGARKNVPGAPSSVPQAEEGAARSPRAAGQSRTNAFLSSDARSH